MNNTLHWLSSAAGRKKGYILALTVIQAAAGMIGVTFAFLFRKMVDCAVGKDGPGFRRSVLLLTGLVLVSLSVSAVIRRLRELAESDLENLFKKRLFATLLRKEYASVSAVHTAEWLNRLTSDTAVVAGGMTDILPGAAGTAVSLISALVMIIALDRWFAYILIPGGILLGLIGYAFRGVLKRLHKTIQERDGLMRACLQERLSSLMVIKAFGAEARTNADAARAMTEHRAARLRRNLYSNTAATGLSASMWGMYLIGIIYCTHGILTERVSYGTLIAVMHLLSQLQGPFSTISGYLPRWYAVSASAERLREAEYCPDDGTASDPGTMREYYDNEFRSLGFRKACFSYQMPGGEDMPAVFDQLDLTIRKGETVAFTGHSGCGKSTVLKLLMCMYPLDGGECFIDGQALTAKYRRLFAYVPQGNVLMSGTIRDVVCFAQPEDDARLRAALSIACADDFAKDPDKMLGERGGGLSEGQMQRLAIARAVYSDAPILLLDEATSALDEQTEKKVLENLRTLTDRTIVAVTHRKAALSICDRVLSFSENGVKEV